VFIGLVMSKRKPSKSSGFKDTEIVHSGHQIICLSVTKTLFQCQWWT
jgi:hypothetical protein